LASILNIADTYTIMALLSFQLITPERTVLKQELDSLSCPTTLGQITILPGHIPLVATLIPGELIARSGNTETPLHVDGGFIEVRPGNQVIALADAAEHATDIDAAGAEQAKRRAEELLAQANISDQEYAQAAAALEKSLTRLRIARKHAGSKHQPITSEGILGQ
jgi:F-type H+-transporting ATPase subunit epsilon